MDIRMPALDGIEPPRRTLTGERTDTRIVMLTTFDLDDYVYEALRAGTSGFLLKETPPEQLRRGRAHGRGRRRAARALCDSPADRGFRGSRGPAPRPRGTARGANARELEVLRHLARGESNAEIARAFVVEESTVKTHVARVLMKLGLRDRVQAVVFAYESGLVRAGGVSVAQTTEG